MPKYFAKFSIVIIIFIIASCGETLKQKGDPAYISQINEWHKKRIENLKKENGWLNLVGLFWLKQGENNFGSGSENDIIFPEGKCEKNMGKFILNDSTVSMIINDGVNVIVDEKSVSELELKNDLSGSPTISKFGSLRWFVIKRGDKYGIRLRDLEAPLVKNFEGIETYPINSDWKIEAGFSGYNPPKKIAVPNVLGTIEEADSPGALVFKIGEQEYKFDALEGGDSYFIVFADETSGNETYGGGRFIYVPKADSSGKIFIDFNKAFNPPCVFTKYATCPLPPKQNFLKLKITAGEKNYGHGNH